MQDHALRELDAAPHDGAGTARIFLDLLEREEILAEFFCGALDGKLVRMFSQLADGPDLRLSGPLR